MTFIDWLSQYRRRKRGRSQTSYLTWDFAHDAVLDMEAPREDDSFDAWYQYLKSRKACDLTIRGFTYAWTKYQKAVERECSRPRFSNNYPEVELYQERKTE